MADVYVRSEDLDREHPASHVSLPAVIGAALLMGTGLFVTSVWILFQTDWVLLGGTVLMAAGFLLLFTSAAGPDRAG